MALKGRLSALRAGRFWPDQAEAATERLDPFVFWTLDGSMKDVSRLSGGKKAFQESSVKHPTIGRCFHLNGCGMQDSNDASG
jgi:hypothetical protein